MNAPAQSRKTSISLAVLFVLCVVAAARLLLASPYISRTTDERAHVAAGMEWLEKHTYFVEELHPPLARVLAALPLYLKGVHIDAAKLKAPCTKPFPAYYEEILASPVKGYFTSRCWTTGDFKLLYYGDYHANLYDARLAGVGWLIIGALYLYALTRIFSTPGTALTAVFIWTMLPPTLAHAGLANTDLAATTAVVMAVTHMLYWLRHRSIENAVLLGAAFAVCGLVKFTAMVFAGAIFLPLLLWEVKQYLSSREPIRSFLTPLFLHGFLALLVMFLLILAAYRFHVGRPADVFPFAYHAMQDAPGSLLGKISAMYLLPMPEWFMGWMLAFLKNAKGQAIFVLGTPLKDVGVWYFFLVALWFKTPLSVWAMVLCALVSGFRQKIYWLIWPTLWCVIILAISMPSNINLGARHILPLFPFLSIIAAAGIMLLWQHRIGRILSVLLLLWLGITSLSANPHYLAFFNSTAGAHPEHILVDSDLAWGQDMDLLADELQKRDLQQVGICSSDYPRFRNYPDDVRRRIHYLCPSSPLETGWLVTNFNMRATKPEKLGWLSHYQPVTVIGSSYELFCFGSSDPVH